MMAATHREVPTLDTDGAAWSPAAIALWRSVRAHRFDDPDAALDLPRRLAREQGWSLAQAEAAIEEYRRFCFLIALGEAGEAPTLELTPSVAVDRVWHLHLCYTRDYWQRFCPNALGMDLHHGPTRGGNREACRFHQQYADTLARYERYFGLPPVQFWPPASLRFAPPAYAIQVDPRRYWLIPKPLAMRPLQAMATLAALLAAVLASQAWALPANPLDWTAGPFLRLYLGLGAVALVFGLWLRWLLRDTGAAASGEIDTFGLAYLSGGPERCIDAAVAQMLGAGQVVWDESNARLQLQVAPADLTPPLDAVARCVAADGAPASVLRRAQRSLSQVRRELERRSLLLSRADAWRIRSFSALPLLLVLCLGMAKILVGSMRDKPVGWLLLISVVLMVAALVALLRQPQTSRAGDAAVAAAKVRHERALRAPRPQELGLAVALLGTAALSGTAYAAYHQIRSSPSGSDSGGSDSSDGSGSGSSGCGGCGGD